MFNIVESSKSVVVPCGVLFPSPEKMAPESRWGSSHLQGPVDQGAEKWPGSHSKMSGLWHCNQPIKWEYQWEYQLEYQ